MFRINAFGQRIRINPYLRYVTDDDQAAAAAAAAEAVRIAAEQALAAKAAEDAQNGFPGGTPVDQMTEPQKAAYWRHESKKQQKINESHRDYDELKAQAAELATIKAANATEQEKAVEQARREGENIGAERYLREAVKGRFQALTGKTSAEVDTTFAHVDPKSFTDDKGEILADKLQTFAATFVTKAGGSGDEPDPVRAALERQRGGGSGGAGSIAELQAQRREKLQPKK